MNAASRPGKPFKPPFLRWALLALIVASGALLRAAYNANTLVVDPVRADAAYYLIYTSNLIHHATFSKDRHSPPQPDSYWAPGYPLFLAAVVRATGEGDVLRAYDAILLAQLLLGVVTILLAYLVAGKITGGYWSLLPPALVALSPHLVSTASYTITETLFATLLLLCILALITAAEKQHYLLWLLAGICCAACYLVNPVSAPIPILFAVGWWWHRRRAADRNDIARTRLAVGTLLLPLLLTAGGWTLRSAVNVPEGQPTSSARLLTNLGSGLYPDFHQQWRESKLHPGAVHTIPGADMDSYGEFFRALGAKLATEPVATIAWYAVTKPLLLWRWDIVVGYGDIYIYRVLYSLYQTSPTALASYSLMRSLHPWLLTCAALGLPLLVFRPGGERTAPATVYLALVSVSLVYMATQAAPRYSIPLRPELYLGAGFFIHRMAQLLWRRR